MTVPRNPTKRPNSHDMGVLSEVHQERVRAHALFPFSSIEAEPWDSPFFRDVIAEEVGEIAKAWNDYRHAVAGIEAANYPPLNTGLEIAEAASTLRDELRTECIQLAAMCTAYIGALDADDQVVAP